MSRDVFVLGTGPSMSQELADSVRCHGRVIAVSDAYRLAPWADALVSTDLAWWAHHKPVFKGERFCSQDIPDGCRPSGARTSVNSGTFALEVARRYFDPTRIILLGFDFSGGHFFGPHPDPLKQTPPHRWPIFQQQFDLELLRCRSAGIELVNSTPLSGLKNIPFLPLESLWTSTPR